MAAEQAETKRDFRPGDIVKHFKRETLFDRPPIKQRITYIEDKI